MKLGEIEYLELNRDNVISRIDQLLAYNKYISIDIKPGKVMSSPFREDNNPSFATYWNSAGYLCYKDFSTGEHGNLIDAISKKYKLKYTEVLKLINFDFKLGLGTNEGIIPEVIENPSNGFKMAKNSTIRVKRELFNSLDLKYWSDFGINELILDKFNVSALNYYWVDFKGFRAEQYTYCYWFGEYDYKIYRPFSDIKFITNTSKVAGLEQLPNQGDVLIITKSLKDVMCLYSLGYNAIAPSSESTFLEEELIFKLKKAWNKIYIMYDYDKTGRQNSELFGNIYNIPVIYTGVDFAKDISDYYKTKGSEETKKLLYYVMGRK